MSKEKDGDKERGPKGGIKHQPGRGHKRKMPRPKDENLSRSNAAPILQ
jgi:hypothetical protein